MSGNPGVPSIADRRRQVEKAQQMVSRLSIELGEAVRERDKAIAELRSLESGAPPPTRVVSERGG